MVATDIQGSGGARTISKELALSDVCGDVGRIAGQPEVNGC